MINTIFLKSGKYTYKVTYKRSVGLPKHRQVKRMAPIIRSPSCIFYDKHDDVFKEIVYPAELHNTEVLVNDPVEAYILAIMEFMPDWQKIEVEP